jgi:hypothetical protein
LVFVGDCVREIGDKRRVPGLVRIASRFYDDARAKSKTLVDTTLDGKQNKTQQILASMQVA